MDTETDFGVFISPTELEKTSNAVLIDTRSPEAYTEGHISGAIVSRHPGKHFPVPAAP